MYDLADLIVKMLNQPSLSRERRVSLVSFLTDQLCKGVVCRAQWWFGGVVVNVVWEKEGAAASSPPGIIWWVITIKLRAELKRQRPDHSHIHTRRPDLLEPPFPSLFSTSNNQGACYLSLSVCVRLLTPTTKKNVDTIRSRATQQGGFFLLYRNTIPHHHKIDTSEQHIPATTENEKKDTLRDHHRKRD